ncbi:MAG: tetratricopeptide repeat protein [Planctomycetes bacterium]|nr:tetratricopeptide repeat protein [Planctomycetota bacterium]
MSAVGRNDPCACGSGRKAKNCCQAGKGPAGTAPSIMLPGAEGLQSRRVPLPEAAQMAANRQQSGDIAGAEGIYRLILAADPGHGDALSFLGMFQYQLGKKQEALDLMRRATQMHPKVLSYHFNLGILHEELKDEKEAIASFRRAIAIEPLPAAWDRLGKLLRQTGELEEAAECCRQAIRQTPRERSANLHGNLAIILEQQGKLPEAMESLETALAIAPSDPALQDHYLYTMHLLPDPQPKAIFEAHQKFGRLFDQPMAPRDPQRDRAGGAQRKLRVGYVSPDFRQHSVAQCIEPVLAAHDPGKVEVFCYSNNAVADETTSRIRKLVPHWHPVQNRTIDEIAELIRVDGIDVLVDLAGHTTGNCLQVFGRKPAPVQVTWIGYPDTTGLTTIDYRITDHVADPPGEADALHTEKLWRLPECFSCFAAPAPSPEVAPLPALASGRITFGSFNNFAKTTPQVIEIWAGLLKRVSGSRLLLKNRSLLAPGVQARIHSMFSRHGVGADRIELLPADASPMEHLNRYHTIDIALDPFPYNGTTTTFEALWMGVPVVVLSGCNHAGRVGASLMSHLGMPEWIARNRDEYAEIAVAMAGDRTRLAALRAGLRQRLMASPLMDAKRFTRNLEQAYQSMWEAHHAESAR